MGARPRNAHRVLGAGAAFLLCMSLCDAAHADYPSDFYIGGSFGRTLNSYNTGYIDRQFEDQARALGDSIGVTGRSVHRFDYVWWGDAGVYFTPYVAVDAAFLHLGELRYKSTGLLNAGGAENSVTTSTEVTSHGPALWLLGRLPLTESFEADLRVGDYVGKTNFYNRIDVFGQSSAATAAKTTSSLLVGAGGAYSFAGHWSVRLDYLRVNKTGDSASSGKFSVNLASAGVSFTF